MRAVRAWRLLCCLCGPLLAACDGTPTVRLGSQCSEVLDCGPGAICDVGRCLQLCASTAHCPEAYTCIDEVCRVQDDARCGSDDECPAYELCVGGMCVECVDSWDCADPPGEYPACFTITCVENKCQYSPMPQRVCEPWGCRDGDVYNERLCGAAGLCAEAPVQSCGGYACANDGLTCLESCFNDQACAPGYFCSPSAGCTALFAEGASCAGLGNQACLSDHCDGALCCSSGDCCNVPADCPAPYAIDPGCFDTSSSTACQGSRVDATCVNHICGSVVAPDDTGCAGLNRECPNNFAPIACLDTVDQPALGCQTLCTAGSDCRPGHTCIGPDCVLVAGTGEACTTAAEGQQGSCGPGLKCEKGICCAVGAASCCDGDPAPCANGLGCDTTVFACLGTCNDYDSASCANTIDTYCFDDACVPRLPLGAQCGGDTACVSGYCVEGVCCESACDALCESCVARLRADGEGDGRCRSIKRHEADIAPATLCTAQGFGCGADSCACDGAGVCEAASGTVCVDAADCASGACECFDSQCTQMRCRDAYCGRCERAFSGELCLSLPAGGLGYPGPVDDPNPADTCQGAVSCFEGSCKKTNGQACAENAECGETCRGSQCRAVSGLGEPCDVGDDLDCVVELVCADSVCRLPLEAPCQADADCGQGFCECGDSRCTMESRRCAPVDCSACEFYSFAQERCSGGFEIDEAEDPEECDATANPPEYCENGRCERKRFPGQSCNSSVSCRDGCCQSSFGPGPACEESCFGGCSCQ